MFTAEDLVLIYISQYNRNRVMFLPDYKYKTYNFLIKTICYD